MNLAILEEIDALLLEVSSEDMERAARDLDKPPKKSTKLGSISDYNTRRIFALSFKLMGQSQELKNNARYKTGTQEEHKRVAAQAERLSDLSEVCRSLFWIQAKDDLTDAGAWVSDATGMATQICTDFTLVNVKHTHRSPLSGLLGGIALPSEED